MLIRPQVVRWCTPAAIAVTLFGGCATPPDVQTLVPGVSIHRAGKAAWIDYAGHEFRTTNLLEAKLGKYGYKIKGTPSAFHAEGDLPQNVAVETAYEIDITYDSARSLKKAGIRIPKIASGEASGDATTSGSYKLYVLKAANEREWKRAIRDGLRANDEDLIEQLKRPDGYFRFVDAVLVISDASAKRRIDAKVEANATYKAISAELAAAGENGVGLTAAAPRVIGYSMRGACWGPSNYASLVGTPADRPAAGDSGACQRQRGHSPVYGAPPPAESPVTVN